MRERILSAALALGLLLGLAPGWAVRPARAAAPGPGECAAWFGSQLDGDARRIYDALASGVDDLRAGREIDVALESRTFSGEELDGIQGFVNVGADAAVWRRYVEAVSNAAAAFDRDHPEVFWTGGVSMVSYAAQEGVWIRSSYRATPGTYTRGVSVTLDVTADWLGGGRSITADENTVTAQVGAVAAQAQAKSTTWEKLGAVHDWLTKNNRYNADAAAHGSRAGGVPWEAVSALDAALSPVCEGYARAFKLVCGELGVPCVLVSGMGAGRDGGLEPHMWNYVQVDGAWYAVDVTWDDPMAAGNDPLESGGEHRDYFLAGSDTQVKGVAFSASHAAVNTGYVTGQTVDFAIPVLSAVRYEENTGRVEEDVSRVEEDVSRVEEDVSRFNDVDGHWAAGAIEFVSSRNLFQGVGGGAFAPQAPMDRAMLVTVLHRLEGAPDWGGFSFADVPEDAYYAGAAAWAAGLGIVRGDGTGFSGGRAISRQELVTMLYRCADRLGGGARGAVADFSAMAGAEEVSDWAREAVGWAVGAGLMRGDERGLRPLDTVTRGEAAQLLMNFVELSAR